MRCYLIGLSLDIMPIKYMFSKTTLDKHDYLLFLLSKTEGMDKINDIKIAIREVLYKIGPKHIINHDFFIIPEEDVIKELRTLLEFTYEKQFDEIYVWLVGGTKAIIILLTLYSQVDPRVSHIIVYNENTAREIRIWKLKMVFPKITHDMLEILKLSMSGNLTIRNAATLMKMNYEKITRIVNRLVNYGFLSKGIGRGGRISITEPGKIALIVNAILHGT